MPGNSWQYRVIEAELVRNDVQRGKTPPTDITDHTDHTDHTDRTDPADHADHQAESTITGGTSMTVTMATSVPPRDQDGQFNLTQTPLHEGVQWRHLGSWDYYGGTYPDGGYQPDQSGMGFGNNQVIRTPIGGGATPGSIAAPDVMDPVLGSSGHHMVPQTSKDTRRQRREKPGRGRGPGPSRELLDHHADLGLICENIDEKFPRQEGSDNRGCGLYPDSISVSSSSSEESTAERDLQLGQERAKRGN